MNLQETANELSALEDLLKTTANDIQVKQDILWQGLSDAGQTEIYSTRGRCTYVLWEGTVIRKKEQPNATETR